MLFRSGRPTMMSMHMLSHFHSGTLRGCRSPPGKVEVILRWPRPTTVTEIRSFLGACTYLRKFIWHFSTIAGPLHALTGTKAKFVWEEGHEKSFQLIKKKITEAPVLALPNLQRTFEVETDASQYALGAVLLQDGKPVE